MTTPSAAPGLAYNFDQADVAALLANHDTRDWAGLLQRAASDGVEAGDAERGATLSLLARACALRLVPVEKPPFLDGLLPGVDEPVSFDGFTEDDIDCLAVMAPAAAPPALRARLADLVWNRTRNRKRHFPLVATAIDAYRMAPLSPECWHEGGCEAWTRALQLASMDASRAGEIEAALVNAFDAARDDDHYSPLHFLEPLAMARRKSQAVDGGAIANRLKALARMWQERHCYHQASAYHLAAQQWFASAGRPADALASLIDLGFCYAAQGEAAGPGAPALTYLEKAIQILRQVPAADRALHRIDERIDTLRTQYRAAGCGALEQMTPISMSSDIGELMTWSRDRVAGLTPREALAALATVCAPPALTRRVPRHWTLRTVASSAAYSTISTSGTMAGSSRKCRVPAARRR